MLLCNCFQIDCDSPPAAGTRHQALPGRPFVSLAQESGSLGGSSGLGLHRLMGTSGPLSGPEV